MLPSDKCEDDCVPPQYRRGLSVLSPRALPSNLFSMLPFIGTFVIVAVLVLKYLFPLIAGPAISHIDDDHFLPSDAPPSLRQAHARHANARSLLRRRLEALSFAVTFALATVLAQLILCEISDVLDPAARATALSFTIPTLLILLILWIPFLELQSLVASAGWTFGRTDGRRIPRLPWIIQLALFAGWLTCFWWMGKAIPATFAGGMSHHSGESLREACLERIGVIGISLMALLAGFASISSPWQSFGVKQRPVTDSDIARKQMGLDATNEMLAVKRSRLRALSRKMSDAPQKGFVKRVIGNFRTNADAQEAKTLELEIAGLESMAMGLSTSVSMLQTRRAVAQRAATPLGKVMTIPNNVFSVYCVYRVIATLLTTLRRWHSPTATFSNSDPINRILGMVARHWDPSLDQQAWSRQISFLLSGVILTLSFSSVMQTFHLFSRFVPGLLYQAQNNMALLVAQISATYVVSSALLLRSNLPQEMGSAISDALGSPLEPYFVERWFEGCFLLASGLTAFGIWAGRRLRVDMMDDDWEDLGDVEMGQKRS